MSEKSLKKTVKKKKEVKKKNKLTIKQAKFVKEYLKSGNGTQAAIKAGYSKNTAQEIASENLSKPMIRQSVADAAAELGIDTKYILKTHKHIIDYNSEKVLRMSGGSEGISIEEMRDATVVRNSTDSLSKLLGLGQENIKIDAEIINTNEDEDKRAARAIAFLLSSQK